METARTYPTCPIIRHDPVYVGSDIMQSIFSVAARRERLSQTSGGGSPRRCAKNALQSLPPSVKGHGAAIDHRAPLHHDGTSLGPCSPLAWTALTQVPLFA